MDPQEAHDAHPLIPLQDVSPHRHHESDPRRASDERSAPSGSYLSSSRLAKVAEEDTHSRAEQWTRDRSFERPQPAVHKRDRSTELPHHEELEEVPRGISPLSENGPAAVRFREADRDVQDPPPDESEARLRKEKRMQTFMEEVPVEERTPNKYIFRRPRALQVEHKGHILDIGDTGKIDLEHPEAQYSNVTPAPDTIREAPKHHPESLGKQRDRIDLFIDLLFVGVISNISEHFFDEAFVENEHVSVGDAIGHFILLYIPAWRIWSILQDFLNSYFMDDLAQRVLVVWVLILAMIWGNNAPFFVGNIEGENVDGSNFLILAYLLAVLSVHFTEMFYSIWIPWLRRMFLIGFLIGIPSFILWIFTTLVKQPSHKTWFLTAAIIYDSLENMFTMTPWAQRLARRTIQKTTNAKHTMARYENFFIIALGEGVILLIRNSPLQQGLSIQLGRGIQTLIIYYYLAWTYFHGDMSKRSVHALYRRWYIRYLWHIMHIPLYGTLIMLSSGTLYLVEYEAEQNIEVPAGEASGGTTERLLMRAAESEPKYDQHTFNIAKVAVCIDVAVVLFCQLVIGLLNRSLDSKRELLVSSQYLRMAPRVLAIIALSVVWIPEYNDGTDVLGVILSIVFFVSVWEFIAGFDRNAKLFEPKDAWGLTPTTSSQA